MVELIKKLCDEVEAVNEFCCFEDMLDTSGSCKAAITLRVTLG